MGVLSDIMAKLGIGAENRTTYRCSNCGATLDLPREKDHAVCLECNSKAYPVDSGKEGTDTQEPAEVTLETKAPREDNAIWSRFDSLEVASRGLTLESTDGDTVELELAGGYDLREEKQIDGADAVYQLSVPPATYDSGTFSQVLMDYSLQADAADLPLEGFEHSTLDFRGEEFSPGSGEEWILTVVFRVSENEAGDAYVLDPALEWRRA